MNQPLTFLRHFTKLCPKAIPSQQPAIIQQSKSTFLREVPEADFERTYLLIMNSEVDPWLMDRWRLPGLG